MTEGQIKKVENMIETEVNLLKSVFTNNDGLLKVIRALFLGLGITEEEKERIRSTFAGADIRAAIKKRFLPELDRDTEIGMVQDTWLGVEEMVFSRPEDSIQQAIEYKQRAIEMTRHALDQLADPNLPATSLVYPGPTEDVLGIELLARNTFIRHVESQLLFIKRITAEDPIDPAKTAKKLKQDSAK